MSEGAMATEGSGGAREQEQEQEEDEDEWQDEVEELAEANRSRGGEEGGAAEDGEAIVERAASNASCRRPRTVPRGGGGGKTRQCLNNVLEVRVWPVEPLTECKEGLRVLWKACTVGGLDRIVSYRASRCRPTIGGACS